MKHLPFFLLFALSLNAQTPDKVSTYQPDDVKLNTKRKPPLTVGECIGFLQVNAPQVFQFRSMMGADTIRTKFYLVDTVRPITKADLINDLIPSPEVAQLYALGTTTAPALDPIDAWAFLSPTKPVTYSTPKIRYVRDTIYKTVYRDFLMHRDTIYQPCQDSPKATTFDGKLWLLACILTALAGGMFAGYAYKMGKKDGHKINRNV